MVDLWVFFTKITLQKLFWNFPFKVDYKSWVRTTSSINFRQIVDLKKLEPCKFLSDRKWFPPLNYIIDRLRELYPEIIKDCPWTVCIFFVMLALNLQFLHFSFTRSSKFKTFLIISWTTWLKKTKNGCLFPTECILPTLRCGTTLAMKPKLESGLKRDLHIVCLLHLTCCSAASMTNNHKSNKWKIKVCKKMLQIIWSN